MSDLEFFYNELRHAKEMLEANNLQKSNQETRETTKRLEKAIKEIENKIKNLK